MSSPLNPAFGVYSIVLPESLTAVPFAGAVKIGLVIRVTTSRSTSLSFAVTTIWTGDPGWVDAASSTATGASLTSATVTVTRAESRPPWPSWIR